MATETIIIDGVEYTLGVSSDALPAHQPGDAIYADNDAEDLSWYSDLHKDVFGCRPRGIYATEAKAREDMPMLHRMLAIEEEYNRRDAISSQYKFERSIEYLIRRGDADNRADAINLIAYQHDVVYDGRIDFDRMAYCLGISFRVMPQYEMELAK